MRLPLFLLGLGVTVAFVPQFIDAAVAPRWALLSVGLPLVLLLESPPSVMGGGAVARENSSSSFFPVALLGLPVALAAMLFLSSLLAPDSLTAVDHLFHGLILCTAFYLGISRTDLSPLWLGIEVGVVISAAIAIAQVLGWQEIKQAVSPAGLFINKNFLGETAMLGVISSLHARRWWTFLPAIVAVMLASSTAVFGALTAILALVMIRGSTYRWGGAALFLALIPAFVVMMGYTTSGTARLEMWSFALADPQVFGHGLGSYSAAKPFFGFAHSEWLQGFYEFGLFIVPLAAIAVSLCLEGFDHVEGKLLAAILLIAVLAFPFHLPATAAAAACAAGLLARRWLLVRLGAHAGASRGAANGRWDAEDHRRDAGNPGLGGAVLSVGPDLAGSGDLVARRVGSSREGA